MAPPRLRGRPAHTPGPTFLAYTPDGTKLITIGLNNAIRVFHTGSDAEPTTIDNCQDSNTAVAAHNDFFITGCEDGTVSKYSLETNTLDDLLTRCTLPVRDIALSPDGNWAAVASDELVVKVVNTKDTTRVLYLREQSKPVKHVSFDKTGTLLAASCSDGVVYIYSLSSEEPQLQKKLDGLVKSLETDAEASSKIIWHPDGRAFAAPTSSKDVQVVSRSDWTNQRVFQDGHTGDISAAAWSPNGALLATTGLDRKLHLWDAKTQKILASFTDIRAPILALTWHPSQNILSYTNNDGELYIHTDFVPTAYESILQKSLQPAPFINDSLPDARSAPTNGQKAAIPTRPVRRAGTPDSVDAIFDDMSIGGDDGDDFIIDDDGAGYVNGAARPNKRPHDGDGPVPRSKRQAAEPWTPTIHEPFQPASTPWRGNRRYLCLNFTGIVWTVNQETHHTVTVEFYDRSFRRDFHFTDPWMYDKACLNDNGALFSSQPRGSDSAQLYYRPHETWHTRADWRTSLPAGEAVLAIALSDSYIVACTDRGFVRVYTLFGVPVRVSRMKASPAVTCAAWRDYVLVVGNGPVGADGRTQLVYSIENVKRDDVCQSQDVVALPPGGNLQSVFWSDSGDPYIFDDSGVLCVLVHWRTPGQARWVPLLDTTRLDRLAGGRREESYWPVAVAGGKFHCIILKGGERYPYFPRPLLSDFDFEIPLSATVGAEDEDPGRESRAHEQAYVLHSTLVALGEDLLAATRASQAQKMEVARWEVEADKALLQLLAAECREGEERGMKALEIVGLMRDRSGRMLDAAGKVARRFGREVLAGKIEEIADNRLAGLDDDDD